MHFKMKIHFSFVFISFWICFSFYEVTKYCEFQVNYNFSKLLFDLPSPVPTQRKTEINKKSNF